MGLSIIYIEIITHLSATVITCMKSPIFLHTSSFIMVALLNERNADVIFLPRSANTILKALRCDHKKPRKEN